MIKPSRETASGLLTHAQEFLDAANLALDKSKNVSLPAYFLLGRSIELSLKAFLLACDISPMELKRRYGHNLQALIDESIRKGIEEEVRLEAIEIGVIRVLSLDYTSKRFEYRQTGGTYHIPLIAVTERSANKLVSGLKPFCGRCIT